MQSSSPLSRPASPADRSSELTAFDSLKYGHIINWTHTSLLIYGRPVTLVCAEFQYFRVPDRERWFPLLADIKAMGFNAVRLYIHWGYHCPAEGVYNFRGNRDIDYLFSLCVKLQLFVIVAPGPYICAEVQAGGFPIWLIAKRDVRVRHLTCPPLGMFKKWDQRWHDHCAEYMRKIIPMLVKWERTTNPNGCIIAMQIENELREKPLLGPGGIDAEIRLLCDTTRQQGSTVPFFHNDDSPIGSWSAGGDYRSLSKAGGKTGGKAYRTDLYGFDLYFTFPPGDRSGDLSSCQVGMLEGFGISSCLNCCGIGGTGVGGSHTDGLSCLYDKDCKHAPPPPLGWADANQMERSVDVLGKMLFKFGGSARYAPPIVAEGQVGWINQWGRLRSYDDVYNFFGVDFSATFQNSLLAQGVTIINHYIAYGGTNHGTVGDTEVYSSYDYSAFIREFGLLSGRGRVLRHSALFARSFADVGFSNSVISERCAPAVSQAVAIVKATVPTSLLSVRDAIPMDGVHPRSRGESVTLGSYAFLRNLRENFLRFSLIVDNVVIPCGLNKCESFIAPLRFELPDSQYSVFACTIPVLCRTIYRGTEMWFLRVRKNETGRLILTHDKDHGGRSVLVKWAETTRRQSGGPVLCGETVATDQDSGAASSLYSGPLEEEPLENRGSSGSGGAPVNLTASTEEVGMCFSFSISVSVATAMSVYDSSSDSQKPMLRLVCLTDSEALTFSADLSGNDCFEEGRANFFSAAWGVSNIAFLPGGILDVGFASQDDGGNLYLLSDGSADEKPEMFEESPEHVSLILPGFWVHPVGQGTLQAVLQQGVDNGDPLSKTYEVEIEKWSMRTVHWQEDVVWNSISYNERDPLDHLMTSGHIAYRVRFRCSSQTGSIVLNIRHSAVIWCNGKAVGGQTCFSHNLMSAGAMHAIDIEHAGKKRHNISNGLQHGPDDRGMHEVVILVFSMGQSRSPFLLNDVRNKRGLLSARLSRRMGVRDVTWDIAGVDVTRSDDAFGSSGLPLEEEANTFSCDNGFVNVSGPEVRADSGLVYYRGTFKVPANSVVGGCVRYPLRLQVLSGAGVRAMIWVNTLFLGRYVETLGPQNDFYVPEGLIKQNKGNCLVVAVYGPVDTNISIKMLPWVVDASSGNKDEQNGQVYALRMGKFKLTPASDLSKIC